MKKPTIFDFQAQVGLTKHLGGMQATRSLIEGCNLEGGERVLEVGCGVGTSAVYLAQTFGCQVTGVDLSERMIQRARERAREKKVDHLTTFRTADMDQLPLPSDTFDLVFCESVLVFSKDKPKAISEMARLAIPGGLVAINESIWLHAPTDELRAWFAQDMAAEASTMRLEEWIHLMEEAGLSLVSWGPSQIEIRNEVLGLFERYGLSGLIKSTLRGIVMYFQRQDYRDFIAETRKSGIAPGNPEEYLGYGLIIAKK